MPTDSPMSGAAAVLRLRPARIAELYPISISNLAKLRCSGRGPAYEKLGHRTVVYRLDVFERWYAEHTRTSTSDPGKGCE